MTDQLSHFCPGCGAPQAQYPRYPWYFCSRCGTDTVDAAGRPIAFSNVSLSGGLAWQYDGEDRWRTAVHVACLINSRPVLVTEARFGGVVVQPLAGDVPLPKGVVDLTKPGKQSSHEAGSGDL